VGRISPSADASFIFYALQAGGHPHRAGETSCGLPTKLGSFSSAADEKDGVDSFRHDFGKSTFLKEKGKARHTGALLRDTP